VTVIRPATKRDALCIAALADIAGHGMPCWFWNEIREREQSVFEFARARAGSDDGMFSYQKVHVVEVDGDVAGMLLGQRQPDPYEFGDLAEVHEVFRPMIELEAEAPGSWYVNMLACFPEYRGQGLGAHLLGRAEALAQETGATGLSLIVESENEGARRLYERTGYRDKARRRFVPFPGSTHEGDWVLMVKEI
jgi:ribosomal protein S18 acetylase RimI-like enzyme